MDLSAENAAAALLELRDFRYPKGWEDPVGAEKRSRFCCEQLEQGAILYLSGVPYAFSADDREFLAGHQAEDTRFHKNVSYRPRSGRLGGFQGPKQAKRHAQAVFGRYSEAVTAFASRLLAPYAPHWSLDYASFRPFEESSRSLPLHKRNDLLHVDAFPTRPTHGGRILRVFTNIHPKQPRVWRAGTPLSRMRREYLMEALIAFHGPSRLSRELNRWLGRLRLKPVDRSLYDSLMLHLHDWMKENAGLQSGMPQRQLEFLPNSTWLVFTDTVPHAVLSGRLALEQTFIVPRAALLRPEDSPIRILEGLSGKSLA